MEVEHIPNRSRCCLVRCFGCLPALPATSYSCPRSGDVGLPASDRSPAKYCMYFRSLKSSEITSKDARNHMKSRFRLFYVLCIASTQSLERSLLNTKGTRYLSRKSISSFSSHLISSSIEHFIASSPLVFSLELLTNSLNSFLIHLISFLKRHSTASLTPPT